MLLTNFPYEFDEPVASTSARSIVDMGIPTDRICLLDSEATEDLSPGDADVFDYFLFGGILGNVDEFDFDRTSVLRVHNFPRRALGSMQMTTDTAVRVSKMILCDKMRISDIPFIDRPELPIHATTEAEAGEGMKDLLVMNFRYVKDHDSGEPLICPKVLELLLQEARQDFDLERLE